MSTMKKFIEPKSDQLNSDDLISGHKVIKITKVRVTETGQQDCIIWFEGDNNKPWKPCKGMGKIIVHAWGDNPQNYVGRTLELFRNPDVKFGGEKVGGIEIAAMSDIEADFTFSLTVSRGYKKPIKIKKLAVASEALLTAGMGAALQGVAALTAWKDALPAADKESVRSAWSGWQATAKEADKTKVA